MKRWRWLAAVLFVIMIGGALVGCGPTGPAVEQILKTSSTDEPETLDPHKTVMRGSHRIIDQILDRLVYIGADGLPKPWIASSWEVKDGGKSIVFQIREDIKFHDGTDLDAEAVAFNFMRLLDPETASPSKGQLGPLQRVTATGAMEVTFEFAEAYAPVWTVLSQPVMGIVSRTAVEKYGEDFGRNVVGSGPMKFDSWVPASEVTLVRNDDYKTWREDVQNKGPWHLEKIVTRFIAEAATSLAGLETGELNMVYPVPYDDIPRLEEDERFEVMFYEGGDNILYVEFNPHKPPFSDLRMRKAVGFAVDADAINEGAYGGYSVLTSTPLPPGVPGYAPDIGAQYGFAFDQDKARDLIAQAGFSAGDPELEPLYWTVNLSRIVKVSEILQSQMVAAGIDMQMEIMEPGAFLQRLREGDQNFNIMKYTNSDPVLMSIMFRSPGWSGMYSNATVDALLDRADTTLEPDQRMEVVRELQKVLLEDAAIIPLLAEAIVTVWRSEVSGIKMDALGWYLFHDVKIGN